MITPVVKALHVFAAMLFLGAGLMSAYYKIRADRSSDLRVIAWCQQEIVRADWLFTVPSGVLLPSTGLWLMYEYGLPWSTGWVVMGMGGYAVAGFLWLLAARLQMRMRKISVQALRDGAVLPEAFHRANRLWRLLGIPAFTTALWTFGVMVAKWPP
jgi:uncharacterized membrane protein